MLKTSILVGLGGFSGSIFRYLIGCAISVFGTGVLPMATLAVNAGGSLLIGVFITLFPTGSWHWLLVTGFCGGFTTFSAFSLELVRMAENGKISNGLIYIILSITICAAAVLLGMAYGDKLLK